MTIIDASNLFTDIRNENRMLRAYERIYTITQSAIEQLAAERPLNSGGLAAGEVAPSHALSGRLCSSGTPSTGATGVSVTGERGRE